MKKNILKLATNLAIDIVFGLISALFAYFVLGEIVPEMLSTSLSLGNGALKLDFLIDKTIMKQVFSVWHNFCLCFGIRFVVAYICGNYKISKDE